MVKLIDDAAINSFWCIWISSSFTFFHMFSRAKLNCFHHHKLPVFLIKTCSYQKSIRVFKRRISSKKTSLDNQCENHFLLKLLFVCHCSLNWMMILSSNITFLSSCEHRLLKNSKKMMMTLNKKLILISGTKLKVYGNWNKNLSVYRAIMINGTIRHNLKKII
jgi:hypothetical protein